MKFNSVKVDASKIETGEWISGIPEMADLELKVRGLGNADYRRQQAMLLKVVPRAKRRGGAVDFDETDRITSTLLLDTVLLDWRGLEDDAGAPIPYSKDFARTLLFEPIYRRVRDAVLYAASLVGEAAAAEVEADVKNSQAP